MVTLILSCPFCCNETFSSFNSLKYHILSLIDNLLCPACNKRFDDINGLADHLGKECEAEIVNNGETSGGSDETIVKLELQGENENTHPVTPKIEMELDDGRTDSSILAKALLASENDESKDIKDGNEEEAIPTYLCQMCNINFDSIEEHLEKYHEGEEVVLETEEDNAEEEEQQDGTFEDPIVTYDDSEEDLIDEENEEEEEEEQEPSKRLKTITEQECFDKEGRLYTRKVVKIDKFWMKNNEPSEIEDQTVQPLLEKYLLENGVIKKISHDDAGKLEDKSGIIEIYQCPRCCLQFPNLDHFHKHKCDPSKAKHKFKCAYCTALFLNLKSLQTHMESHAKNHPTTNIRTTITLGPYNCDICQTKFPSFKSLRLHSRMHEPVQMKQAEAPVSYSICGPEERENKMFICPICEKSYNIEYKDVHMKSHTEEDNNCTICNRKFSKENLEMHMKAHSNVKKFACSYCKKPFLTYDALNDHINQQCQKRQYECQFCGRRFARPHEKVKHERIHTGEKPHICEICGKAFRVSYCLTLHMRTHSGTRPYQCQHCSKRFKSHSAYNHHLLTHSDVRAYKCPFCPKAFKTMVQLAGHKNSHIKPFACTECNRPFASLYAVRAHMDTHKRDNNLKYDCWLCGASYARAFALRDHMKAQHEDSILGGLENENENDSVNEENEVAESTSQIEHELKQAMEVEEDVG